MDASHVYVRAWALGCFLSVHKPFGGRGDKECPFSGVTKSGRVWRKVTERDFRSVRQRQRETETETYTKSQRQRQRQRDRDTKTETETEEQMLLTITVNVQFMSKVGSVIIRLTLCADLGNCY